MVHFQLRKFQTLCYSRQMNILYEGYDGHQFEFLHAHILKTENDEIFGNLSTFDSQWLHNRF